MKKYTISRYAELYNNHASKICVWVKAGKFELEKDVVGTNLILDNDANRSLLFQLTRKKRKKK